MQDVLYSALSTVFNLTCAAVPVLPLLGKKWAINPSSEKMLVQHQSLEAPQVRANGLPWV